MQKWIKVKKWVQWKVEHNIIQWKYIVYDENWEQVPIIPRETKYKYKLSNNKKFMKKLLDRKISKMITQNLRDVDLWFLYKIEAYIDDENMVNLKKFKLDYKYSDSKLSKSKKPLLEAWVLKEKEGFIYLNPLVWFIWTEVRQELIEIFEDVFEKYNVKITF